MERSDPTRITAFTDGVMAVAITLLVLNIEVPTVPDSELASNLDDLITPLGAYALSFALVIFVASIPVAYIATQLAMALWVSAIFVRYPLRLVAARGDETSS